MCILAAEDEPETAQFVANGLREHGHNVLLAGTGLDALHFGLTEDVSLMILDRMLPELNGLSVLLRLRAAGITAPAIMLTALGRIEDRIGGLDAGADDYLVKPSTFGELFARVNALSRRAAPQEAVTRLVGPHLYGSAAPRGTPRRRADPASAPRVPCAGGTDAPHP
ncbi:response regulator [Novosphingobium pentaromativorans]|uniref:Two-component system, OmpR family, response regulator n=1 Tax=Novosphingobium pentaromativorans US6-1 TaxID=1088721 RepID=G6EDI1_9SPHN|nr:two-component system, OmpR family, response regulator [Novosphingobium pentaromativorans US6-1]